MTERQILLTIPGTARFLLTEGRDIAVAPAPGRLPNETAALLVGTVLGILLQQRGRIVLHASAVEVGNRAMLFCGASGDGKSTLAAGLSKAGHALLSDDLCAIELRAAGPPAVHPDGQGLTLWAEALDALDLKAPAGGAVRAGLEKYRVEPPSGRAAGPLPVAAIYELRESRGSAACAIEALAGMDAVRALGNSAYRPRLVAGMGQSDLYFRGASALARAAGVFAFTRPLDFARMDESIAALESHWSASGPGGAAR
jgi:hypothetical protein